MSNRSWLLAVFWSATRPCGAGAMSSVLHSVTNGIWTKYSSRSTASHIISGERSIRTALSLTFSFNPSATDLPQLRFFRKLLRATGRQPRVILTDKLRSYGAAKRVVMPSVAHRQHRYLNNRAENSHQPTRERERRMRRFQSARHRAAFCRGARNHSFALPPPTPPTLRR